MRITKKCYSAINHLENNEYFHVTFDVFAHRLESLQCDFNAGPLCIVRLKSRCYFALDRLGCSAICYSELDLLFIIHQLTVNVSISFRTCNDHYFVLFESLQAQNDVGYASNEYVFCMTYVY